MKYTLNKGKGTTCYIEQEKLGRAEGKYGGRMDKTRRDPGRRWSRLFFFRQQVNVSLFKPQHFGRMINSPASAAASLIWDLLLLMPHDLCCLQSFLRSFFSPRSLFSWQQFESATIIQRDFQTILSAESYLKTGVHVGARVHVVAGLGVATELKNQQRRDIISLSLEKKKTILEHLGNNEFNPHSLNKYIINLKGNSVERMIESNLLKHSCEINIGSLHM